MKKTHPLMSLHFTFMIETLLADTTQVAFVVRVHHIHVCVIVATIFDHFQAQLTFDGLMPICVMFSQSLLILVRGFAQRANHIVYKE